MPNTYDGNMKLQKLVDYLSNDKLCSINYPLIKPEWQVTIGGFFMEENERGCEVNSK